MGTPKALLRSGAALAKAEAWFAAQGRDEPGSADRERLVETPLATPADGYLATIDAGAVGELVLDLGGGRRRKDDTVDLQVGVTVHKLVGDSVAAGEKVLTVHSRAAIGEGLVAELTARTIDVKGSRQGSPHLFL